MIEGFLHAVWVIAGINEGRVLEVVGRQVRKHPAGKRQRFLIVIDFEVSCAADTQVDIRAAKRFEIDYLAGYRFDHLRAGQEHVGLLLDHDDQVLHGG